MANDESKDEKRKSHRERKSGRKADKKKQKKLAENPVLNQTDKQRNPKAFAINSAIRAERRFRRKQDIDTKKQHIPLVDRTPLEPPPVLVAVVGPPKVGKSTLIQNLIKLYSRSPLVEIQGPVTLVIGKKRRITFVECNNDINSMIDLAKVADLVLLLCDASFGFEMEVFEFLNICQVHGMPRIMGVLTHLDMIKNAKTLKNTKKVLKHRFWTEVYPGAKLFYLSGIVREEYLKNEIRNLGRFISVMKFRPLTWRSTHGYMLGDRYEDLTNQEEVRQNPKCNRNISLYGYLRGLPIKPENTSVHVAGLGDLKLHQMSYLPDPCPLPDKLKKRALIDKEKHIYAPFSGVGGIVYDKDAVYLELRGSHSYGGGGGRRGKEEEGGSEDDDEETQEVAAELTSAVPEIIENRSSKVQFLKDDDQDDSEDEKMGDEEESVDDEENSENEKNLSEVEDENEYDENANEESSSEEGNEEQNVEEEEETEEEHSSDEENAEKFDEKSATAAAKNKTVEKKKITHGLLSELEVLKNTFATIKEDRIEDPESGRQRRKVKFTSNDDEILRKLENSDEENAAENSNSSEKKKSKKRKHELLEETEDTDKEEILAASKKHKKKSKISSGSDSKKRSPDDFSDAESEIKPEKSKKAGQKDKKKHSLLEDSDGDGNLGDSDDQDSDISSDSDSESNNEEDERDKSEEKLLSEDDKDGDEDDLQWKDDLMGMGSLGLKERQNLNQDWNKVIYGVFNKKRKQEAEDLEDGEEKTNIEDSDNDDIFKVASHDQKKLQLDKELRNVTESSLDATRSVSSLDWKDDQDKFKLPIHNCFVTGKWSKSEDAEELLKLDDLEVDSSSDLDGDFEDLETGTKHTASSSKKNAQKEKKNSKNGNDKDYSENDEDNEDPEDEKDSEKGANADEDLKSEREAIAERKRKLKESFDAEYDDGKATFYDDLKQTAERQAQLNKTVFEGFSDEMRVQIEGFRPGMYVRMEFRDVPVEFVENFDPMYPLVVGVLNSGEENIGYVNVRIKKHRWYNKILKTGDPLIISMGWRRFQTVPLFSKLEDDLKSRYLKYTPKHLACNAHFWGPITPLSTGFVALQSVESDPELLKNRGFRIAATGAVQEVDESTRIMKKLKLVGYPMKIYKKTVFVKGMFNSPLEVARFEGARLKTVSGVRGQIKKAISKPEGCFRATFEDKIKLSDIIFCRTWFKVDVPRFYNTVTSLCLPHGKKDMWRGMRTVGEVKREKGIKNEVNPDHLYTPIEREPRPFKPLTIPAKLQRKLPYRDKPKFQAPKKSSIDRVAVIKEPHEEKIDRMMKMIKTLYEHKQERLKTESKKKMEEHRKMVQAQEDLRTKKLNQKKKEVFRARSKAKK